MVWIFRISMMRHFPIPNILLTEEHQLQENKIQILLLIGIISFLFSKHIFWNLPASSLFKSATIWIEILIRGSSTLLSLASHIKCCIENRYQTVYKIMIKINLCNMKVKRNYRPFTKFEHETDLWTYNWWHSSELQKVRK